MNEMLMFVFWVFLKTILYYIYSTVDLASYILKEALNSCTEE